jgi:hypothetical protein
MLNTLVFKLSCLCLLASLCACAHVERVGFDNPTRTVRYCGNKHASEADVLAEARHECSARRELEVIRCMREQVGEQADSYHTGLGLTVTSVNATYGTCCDFRCVDAAQRWGRVAPSQSAGRGSYQSQ